MVERKSVVILARESVNVALVPWYSKQSGDYVTAIQKMFLKNGKSSHSADSSGMSIVADSSFY